MSDARRISGVGLTDVFRSKDGRLWKVVGIAETPTVTIEHVGMYENIPVEDKTRHHLVIGSGLFNEFEQLVPKPEAEPPMRALSAEEAERLREDFRRRAE